MKINVIQHCATLRVTKGNTNGAYVIPYHMDNYTPLLKHLNTFLPEDYQTEYSRLLKQEQAIIQQRRDLVQKCKDYMLPIIQRETQTFKIQHPEYFI